MGHARSFGGRWIASALGAIHEVEEERRKFKTTKLGALGSRQIERGIQ
jgi:hypothetical protein